MKVELPKELQEAAQAMAEELGVSVEALVIDTLSERIRTWSFFKARTDRAPSDSLMAILDGAPDRPPFKGDEIPADVVARLTRKTSIGSP